MKKGQLIVSGICVCFLLSLLLPSQGAAVPAAPIEHTLAQPDGSKFKARQWGDEHRHGWETHDGYAIGFDEAGKSWHFLEKDKAGAMRQLPEKPGIDRQPRSLQRHMEKNSPSKSSTALKAPAQTIAGPRLSTAVTGTGYIPVILIRFSDLGNTFTKENFTSLIFGTGVSSMKDFHEEASYGQFTLSSGPQEIAGWHTSANTHYYYGRNDVYGNDKFPGTLVREAIAAADAQGFDFAPYDQDGDGYVDVVAIVHAGTGEESGPNKNDIWSHSWNLDEAYRAGCSNGGKYLTHDYVYVNNYIIMPEKFGGSISTMGVFAHEYGHALGLPDLYDTDSSSEGDGSSEGIGNWSLMAGGAWNGEFKDGSSPAHPDAWCKYALGWIDPVRVAGPAFAEIDQASAAGDVYQLGSGSPSGGGEYFLVENRQATGFDAHLPGSGLLIWHIDESKNTGLNNNNNAQCESGPGTAACISAHYHVALMQADNNWDLENDLNRGDAGDPFPGTSGKTSFESGTSPCSSLWSTAGSNVTVTGIGASGAVMEAYLFGPSTSSSSSTTTVIDDFGNSCAEADNADLATPIAGVLNYGDDRDYFKISVPLDGALTAYTLGLSNPVPDTLGLLKNEACANIAIDDDSGVDVNFSITRVVTAGVYYLAVKGYDASETGNYTVRINFNTTTTTTSSVSTTTTSNNVADCVNLDGDGYGVGPSCAKIDCDDTDPGVNPEADEICQDGIDNDCNPDTPDDCRERCFFSAVLGRDHPQLESLRALRDQRLVKTAPGRAAIGLYYRTSDLICAMIERNSRLKELLRPILELFLSGTIGH